MKHLREYWIVYCLVVIMFYMAWVFIVTSTFKPIAVEKYTQREHWVMDEVLSKIKPECLITPAD